MLKSPLFGDYQKIKFKKVVWNTMKQNKKKLFQIFAISDLYIISMHAIIFEIQTNHIYNSDVLLLQHPLLSIREIKLKVIYLYPVLYY